MTATLSYDELVALNLIYDTIYFINASAPIPLFISLQRFRFADTCEGMSVDIFKKVVDAF